jgi:cytochrome P450
MNETSFSSIGLGLPNHDFTVMAGTLSLVALSSLGLYGYLWIEQKKKKAATPCFKEQGIPMAEGANFLLGHITLLHGDGDFRTGYKRVYEAPADPSSGICSLWFVTRPTLSVLLSRHVKMVLSTSSYRESNALMDQHNHNFLGPKGLTALNGKQWKVYRSAVHKSFTPSALKQSQRCIHIVGNTLVRSLLEKIRGTHDTKSINLSSGSVEGSIREAVLPLMKMATIDVFGLAIMDVDFQCCEKLELTPVASAFEFLAEEYTRRLRTPWDPASWLYKIPTKANRRHTEQRTFIRGFIATQIGQAKDKIKREDEAGGGNGQTYHDEAGGGAELLTNILKTAAAEAAKDGSDGVSESGILDLVMTLLFGGYDTTSITLSYALYLMANHPEIQQECLKEIDMILPKLTETESSMDNGNDMFVLDDPVRQLPYTHAVVLETLRLFPPAPVTLRTLEKPMELDGKVFPERTNIMVPIWSIQRDARNFPQPMEMHPTRWVTRRKTTVDGESDWEERPYKENTTNDDGGEGQLIPPADRDAFCVFAAGARNCVGRKLALQEAVTLLAVLVRNLHFTLVEEGYEVTPKLCSVVQQPEHGLPMIISARGG